jgi:hypothetical protein
MGEKLILSRRALILGLTGVVAAPALVRAASLMPISAPWELLFARDYWRAAIPTRMTVYRKNGVIRIAHERLPAPGLAALSEKGRE